MTSQQTSNKEGEAGELIFNEPMKIELQASENGKTTRWIISPLKPASTEPSSTFDLRPSTFDESCDGNTNLSEEVLSTEQRIYEELTSNLKREKSQEMCSIISCEEVTPNLKVVEKQESEVYIGRRCFHVGEDQCCGNLDLEGWYEMFSKECQDVRENEENVPIKNISKKHQSIEEQCVRSSVEKKFPCRSVSEYSFHSKETTNCSFKKVKIGGDSDEEKQNGRSRECKEKNTSGHIVWKFITPDNSYNNIGCKCCAPSCNGSHFGCKCHAPSCNGSHVGCKCHATNCCGSHVERKRKAPSFFESHLGCKRVAPSHKDSSESVELSKPFTLKFKRGSLVANLYLRPEMSPNRTQEETLERRRDASVQTMTDDDVIEK